MQDIVQAVVSGLFLGAVISLVSVGLTVVFGVTNMVNFAHGEFIMLAMYIGFFAWSLLGLDPLVSIPLCAVAMGGVGFLVYRGVIRPVQRSVPLAQIVVTFGLMTLIRGTAQFAWTPNPQSVSAPIVGSFRLVVAGIVMTGPQLASALGAVVCTGFLAWFVYRTETGRAMRAVSEDRAGAALVGISPHRMYALAWTLAGVATGVGGALLINNFEVNPLAGVVFAQMSFVAIALGGFGSVVGAAVAGLCIGVVQGVVGLYAPSYTLAAALVLYLVVLVVRPQGLRGNR